MGSNVLVKLVDTREELTGAAAVRRRVFVEEQGVPLQEEYDAYDAVAVHAVALVDGQVIATGRLFTDEGGEAHIGRMAVDARWRRGGIGGRILEALEEEARRQKIRRIVLHAQTYVRQFYAAHGYAAEGPLFAEAGIEHIAMEKAL